MSIQYRLTALLRKSISLDRHTSITVSLKYRMVQFLQGLAQTRDQQRDQEAQESTTLGSIDCVTFID